MTKKLLLTWGVRRKYEKKGGGGLRVRGREVQGGRRRSLSCLGGQFLAGYTTNELLCGMTASLGQGKLVNQWLRDYCV